MLEEKGDLELSLSHVKEISSYDDRIAQHLTAWGESLRNIALQEQSLCEHYTVVQVYRSALEKDNRELFRVSAASVFLCHVLFPILLYYLSILCHSHILVYYASSAVWAYTVCRVPSNYDGLASLIC